ncbi:MAG: SDR family oxidoreductase, partial [bacterium]
LTPALTKIPGHQDMIEKAQKYNPGGRLTTPTDVANAIMLLSHPASYWITGNTIYVDGGEFLT